MFEMSEAEFEAVVARAVDAIPHKYTSKMQNIGFVVEDNPSMAQRSRLQLCEGQTLYGLYEGIPLTQRGSGYNLVLPDKITIFRNPILGTSRTEKEVVAQVNKTVWHEVAHHFGLGHEQIHNLEAKS